MTFAFTVSATIPASPRAVYDAWLDGKAHGQMTGGIKATASTRIGGKFTAHGGYISGTNLELTPGKRIVQSWRTTRFSDLDADSQIALTLTKVARGTRVRLRHSKVPTGHDGYKSGWKTHYFEPMKRYFSAKN
jgi:uncharacterized protein YndB with AHSA1/START domain